MTNQSKINNVVILGGGTAGWMTAAALSKSLSHLNITLVESDRIGTIGVGEATIPTMQFFNNLLGIPQHEFLKQTQGSYKLGIQFENWRKLNHDYFHAFGSTGKGLWAAGFHDFWRKGVNSNACRDYSKYNIEAVAAKAGKFGRLQTPLNHAYHLDAGLYAKMLRSHSEKQGVKRIEGDVEHVCQDSENGYITGLTLKDGSKLDGDLFVDCSGFKGMLINETMKVPFNDWPHWLPNDRAIAVQTRSDKPPAPYTRSIAHHAGWQWRIPLQHRMGNGIVYASEYMSDDEAEALLLSSVEGEVLTTPRPIKFKTGYRQELWHKNCVAIGLSGGFIEPLESTAIHLIQQGILRLIKLFPEHGIDALEVAEYNLSATLDYEQIKDFIVLHYKVTERDDSPYWRFCRGMDIPESLEKRLNLFKKTGRFIQRQEELFVDSWLQVMIGQGLVPERYHRIVDEMTDQQLEQFLDKIASGLEQQVATLPSHAEYLKRYCSASL